MLIEPDTEPKMLQNINIPVLITVGENDLILPEETKRIVDNLKDVKLVVLDGEDHGSYIENSEIMGNILMDFLKAHEYD